MPDFVQSSAFVAAITFGFRHGFDWDHIAALADLTGSQHTTRRSMFLATLYALGHAVMVLLLGLAAILLAERLPGAVDTAMERFVGASLIALGLYIAWTALQNREPIMRSRWMLLLSAVKRGVGHRLSPHREVVIEHSHPHDHNNQLHRHDHFERDDRDHGHHGAGTPVAMQHSHAHRHVAALPTDPFISYGNWSSFGIGMLHGVGAETPTQVLIFAAAANATSDPASVGMLLCFITGVLGANTVVAAASTYGFRSASRRQIVTTALSILTAVFSLVIGVLLLVGRSTVLPAILGG